MLLWQGHPAMNSVTAIEDERYINGEVALMKRWGTTPKQRFLRRSRRAQVAALTISILVVCCLVGIFFLKVFHSIHNDVIVFREAIFVMVIGISWIISLGGAMLWLAGSQLKLRRINQESPDRAVGMSEPVSHGTCFSDRLFNGVMAWWYRANFKITTSIYVAAYISLIVYNLTIALGAQSGDKVSIVALFVFYVSFTCTLVLWSGVLLILMGERTTPAAFKRGDCAAVGEDRSVHRGKRTNITAHWLMRVRGTNFVFGLVFAVVWWMMLFLGCILSLMGWYFSSQPHWFFPSALASYAFLYLIWLIQTLKVSVTWLSEEPVGKKSDTTETLGY